MSALKKNKSIATKWLQDNQYPSSDNIKIEESKQSFDNGATYGIEIPVINSFSVLKKTISSLSDYNLQCDRFNETKGVFLLSDSEISDMLALCRESNIGITFSLSARPEYDVSSSFYKSAFGMEQCRKLNNMRSISATLDEACRLATLGCRGLIVYDIGVLSLLNQMRTDGLLPSDMYFKASSHCMATNPFITQLLFQQGANSVTTVHDASISILQQTRKLCGNNHILDIPIDVYADKGGFIRFNEIADIILTSSPCILKLGASAQKNPYNHVGDDIVKERVRRAALAHEHLVRQLGDDIKKPIPDYHKCLPITPSVAK